jgi:hypothetical protein
MQIEKQSFEVPIYISHLENHEKFKKQLLDLVDSIDAPSVDVSGSPIARSSYGKGELNRIWHPLFMQAAESHMTELFNQLNTPNWEIRQMWFQTYQPGNLHRAHTHGGYTWANVYYLNLPNPAIGTVFYHPARHWVELRSHRQSESPPVLRPIVREGDIVTFPGYLEHEAPLVSGADTKTIISFNVLASSGPANRKAPPKK